MPLDPAAETVVTGFRNTPEFAHGIVRDIRIRWALEEIGRPYRTELYDAMKPRADEYLQWQPFGQVPAFADGKVRLFESGAILLYLGEQDERLLPAAGQRRWDTTAWLIAALNSVEPMLMQIVTLDIFYVGKPWAADARPSAVALAEQRLARLADALGDKDWLAGRFTIADIAMVTVLRNLRHTEIVAGFPAVAAYQARGEARPAFSQALADQIAGLKQGEPA
ncbi:MAG: glutathione S-transferase family protein [Novosphingobium sp.]|nr:glutathione S-transferase family protein [Novosphingobium sp.]